MTNMEWTDNQVLLKYSLYTPCQDIFQAVCDEIGKHYSNKGFKYARSRPKLTVENERIRLEISFWSTRANTPGDFVGLEILPTFYSKQLKKDSDKKGLLFGDTGIFYHRYKEDKSQIRVNQIFGEILERVDEHSHESKIIDSNCCNIYGIDKDKFDMIIDFIDTKILPWLDKLQDIKGINELLDNASATRLWTLKQENSDFIKYTRLNFPELESKELLEK